MLEEAAPPSSRTTPPPLGQHRRRIVGKAQRDHHDHRSESRIAKPPLLTRGLGDADPPADSEPERLTARIDSPPAANAPAKRPLPTPVEPRVGQSTDKRRQTRPFAPEQRVANGALIPGVVAIGEPSKQPGGRGLICSSCVRLSESRPRRWLAWPASVRSTQRTR